MGCCFSAPSGDTGSKAKVTNIPLFGDSGMQSQNGLLEPGSLGTGTGTATNALRRFTLKELQTATGKFKKDNELGQGSFGKVYKGTLDDWTGEIGPGHHKRTVAVKVLDEDSFQGFGEWMAEVLLLGRLQHPNLVRLLGYSTDKDEAILVYEFLGNGSLDGWLFSSKKRPLSWPERARIALDATEGLGYLHAQNIIHRDFKSCNILLGDDFTAKLTDFGMATTGPEQGQTHVSTRVMGTMGYLDPKYMETGHLTTKSDIYALGVVFLELLTGRPPTVDDEGEDESSRLTAWIRPHLAPRRPNLKVIMDPRLEDRYPPVAAHKLLVLAKHCVSEDPDARPQIPELLKTLRQVADSAVADVEAAVAAAAANGGPSAAGRVLNAEDPSGGEGVGANGAGRPSSGHMARDSSIEEAEKVFQPAAPR